MDSDMAVNDHLAQKIGMLQDSDSWGRASREQGVKGSYSIHGQQVCYSRFVGSLEAWSLCVQIIRIVELCDILVGIA